MAILATAVLSACVALAPAGDKAKGPNPVTGGEIEVTSLDAPEAPAAPGKAAKKPKPGEEKPDAKGQPAKGKPPEKVEQVAPADAPATKPKPRPETAPKSKTEAEPEAEGEVLPELTTAAPAPGKAKSPAQIACEKKKGNVWSKAGKSGASACIKLTRDSGKRCTSGGDCEGECLARSGSCAPYTPLFGCNEILQDNGSRVTLCLD